MNNPDGAELFHKTAQTNRSNVRPHDTDRDSLLDEGPGEDLNGDGYIREMRENVGEGKGNAILDPRDKTGRLMKKVPDGDWMVYPEGLDDDLDGKYNEDGIGGLDLHRNYLKNWRPEPGRDATGRGFTQGAAGAFPLSEPETRAVVLFLLTHPNISIGQSMDAPMPMHLRPPSTSKSEERMFEEDLKWYRCFDREGKKSRESCGPATSTTITAPAYPPIPSRAGRPNPRPRPEGPIAEDPRRQLRDWEALGVIGSSLSFATTPN